MRGRNKEQIKMLLDLASQGLSQKNIATSMKVSPSWVLRNAKALETRGLLKIISGRPTFYELTQKPQNHHSLTTTENVVKKPKKHHASDDRHTSDRVRKPIMFKSTINFHDFKLSIPIAKHGKKPEGGKSIELNNWIKEIHHIDAPVKITLELTTKSAVLHFHRVSLPRNAQFFSNLFEFVWLGAVSTVSFLGRSGYQLSVSQAKVISQHIATETNEATDSEIPNGTVVTKELKRQARSISGEMKQKAKAWVDKSRELAEVETNDLLYEEKLLMMPETIEELKTLWTKNIGVYNKNIIKHLATLDDIRSSTVETKQASNEMKTLMRTMEIHSARQTELMEKFVEIIDTRKGRKSNR